MDEIKYRGFFLNNLFQVDKKYKTYSFYKIYKQGNPGHYTLISISLVLIDCFEPATHLHPLHSTIHPSSYVIALGTQLGQ